MRIRRPGWLTIVTVLVGLAAVSFITVRPTNPPAASATARSTSLLPVPPAPSSSPPNRHTQTCTAIVDAMPIRTRLAQLLMVGVGAGDAVTLVRDDHVGGLFVGSDDTHVLTDGTVAKAKAASAVPLFVSIDEEGGRVQRLPGPHGPLPSARTMAATMTTDQVQTLARSLGVELRGLGVNVDLAPDADVSDQPANAVIGDRSFSNDPATVTRYADAFAAGLRGTGVLPVLKHFPGHGHATGDSHTGSAVTPPLASLQNDDLVPYRTIPPATAVMVGHLDVPGLTGSVPASLSPAAYQLLRSAYHFDGVVITDDLGGMSAVTARYGLSDAVRLALASGADMALWTTGGQVGGVLDALTSAVASGTLSQQRVDEAATRVLVAKGMCTN